MPDSRASPPQPNTSTSNAQELLIQTLIFKSLSNTEIANSVRPCCDLVILPGGHQQTPSHCPWSLCNPFPSVLSCLSRQLIQTFLSGVPGLQVFKGTVAKAHGFLPLPPVSLLIQTAYPLSTSHSVLCPVLWYLVITSLFRLCLLFVVSRNASLLPHT